MRREAVERTYNRRLPLRKGKTGSRITARAYPGSPTSCRKTVGKQKKSDAWIDSARWRLIYFHRRRGLYKASSAGEEESPAARAPNAEGDQESRDINRFTARHSIRRAYD